MNYQCDPPALVVIVESLTGRKINSFPGKFNESNTNSISAPANMKFSYCFNSIYTMYGLQILMDGLVAPAECGMVFRIKYISSLPSIHSLIN